MKTILCYGDSNTWGKVPKKDISQVEQFNAHQKWTGVLAKELGTGYRVIDNGLRNRTTVRDDPVEGADKNGLYNFANLLKSLAPIDFVVIYLGTNDLKKRFAATPADIAGGIARLIEEIRNTEVGPKRTNPNIIVVCPPPLGKLTAFADVYEGGSEKSKELSKYYQVVSKQNQCAFLDLGKLVRSSDNDGVHLDLQAHQKVGSSIAKIIRDVF